jgi:hypothetical protein
LKSTLTSAISVSALSIARSRDISGGPARHSLKVGIDAKNARFHCHRRALARRSRMTLV